MLDTATAYNVVKHKPSGLHIDTTMQSTSLAAKVMMANKELVSFWAPQLVGKTFSELCDMQQDIRRMSLISVIDLPSNFCIAPDDEPLSPSEDPSRVIVIVSPDGRIIDLGVYDMNGPVFYTGDVDGQRYMC
ncbi:hypothetical protein FBU59_003309 [Linderina macrospora]|uniref:Uncharacterized protein n=1 Tax=Linderina macrospora TaxID=4868 RepID=A0ACC1J8P0_9FUNG|nr:hypothetical protein FBU59_003309 [Linderina macrospora]